MKGQIIKLPLPSPEMPEQWEKRYHRQLRVTNKLSIKEFRTRQLLKTFAEVVTEHCKKNGGDTYLVQEAALVVELLDKGA
jgi:hypothetical protein